MKFVVLGVCGLVLLLGWAWLAPSHVDPDPGAGARAPATSGAPPPRVEAGDAAARRPVARAPEARVWFVEASDGRPVPGVRLLRADGECTLDPDAATAVADVGGAIELAAIATDCDYVAFREGMVPLPVAAAALVAEAVFRLERGGTVTVWCVDEAGVALPGVWVQATSVPVAEVFAFDAVRPGIANPHRQTAAAFACSDHRGIATIPSRPFGECFLRAQHPTRFLDAAKSDGHRPLARGVTSPTLHFRTAMGVVAALPDGGVATAWSFVVTPKGFEREVYAMARSIAADLRHRFPGAGSHVLARFVDGPAPRVAVGALAADGSLWTGETGLVPVASIREPLVLQPATQPSGWVQVTVRSADRDVADFRLQLVSNGQAWDVTSGRPLQLPCDRYHLSPMQLCPVVDEVFDGKVVDVLPSSREQCTHVTVDLGAVGLASIEVRSETTHDVDTSVSVQMPGGHAFTMLRTGPALRLYLPPGEHRLQVSAPDHVTWQGATTIRAGETSSTAIVLARRRD